MFRGLSDCKSSLQKIGGSWLGDQGLGEWVAIYEILIRALVKQHSLYSHDLLLLSKGLLAHSVHGREDAEIVCYICVGKGLLPAGLWLVLCLLLGYTQCLRWDVMRRERSYFHGKAAHRNPGKQNSFPHSTTKFLCDAGQSLRLVLSQVANNYMFHHLKVHNLD